MKLEYNEEEFEITDHNLDVEVVTGGYTERVIQHLMFL